MPLKYKIYSLIAGLIAGFFVLCVSAQFNYSCAINAVNKTDRTDSDIEQTMARYGFTQKWHQSITLEDKIEALFR